MLGEVIAPREKNAEVYKEGYQMYLDLQQILAPTAHRLAKGGPS
jgi:hypothetical protein